jgi:hypothetical protein
MKKVIICLFIIIFSASMSKADAERSVNSAYVLCSIFDNTDLQSEPCSVSGWHHSVNVRLDMVPSEAKKLCRDVASKMRSLGHSFDTGWKLHIYSPFSGDNTTAQCAL